MRLSVSDCDCEYASVSSWRDDMILDCLSLCVQN